MHGPGADEPLVVYTGTGTGDSAKSWLLANAQGSIIAGTSSTGAASYINTYDAYGRPGAGNSGRFQYTGQTWIAEAGLYNYKARVYDPALGRFLQTDPISYAGGVNLYAYVGNDPVNFTDPSGLERQCQEYPYVSGAFDEDTSGFTLTIQKVYLCFDIPDLNPSSPNAGGGGGDLPQQVTLLVEAAKEFLGGKDKKWCGVFSGQISFGYQLGIKGHLGPLNGELFANAGSIAFRAENFERKGFYEQRRFSAQGSAEAGNLQWSEGVASASERTVGWKMDTLSPPLTKVDENFRGLGGAAALFLGFEGKAGFDLKEKGAGCD